MIDCAVNGDSIAVGIAPFFPKCVIEAKVGASSAYVLEHSIGAELMIISAGSNDPNNPNLGAHLDTLRLKAKRAIWILPRHPRAAGIVLELARKNGDRVVSFKAGRDGIHPLSYQELANEIHGRG